MTSVAFAAAWLLTLAGGLIVLGALGALTNDSGISPLFGPYRLAWTAWSYEVFALLVALYALVLGPYRQWRATVLYFYAAITPTLIGLTNDVLVAKGQLPGSNGSDTRANAVAAGLVLVLIGNSVQALLSAVHDVEPSSASGSHNGSASSSDGKGDV